MNIKRAREGGLMSRADSWTFTQDVEETLHILLYIRAALGFVGGDLDPPEADVEPRVEGLTDNAVHARDAWQVWWDGAVGRAALLQGARRVAGGAPPWVQEFLGTAPAGSRDDPSAWPEWSAWRYRLASTEHLPSPPTFDGLDPALRATAVACGAAATGWARSVATAAKARGDRVEWSVVRDAAEAVAFDTGTPVGRLHAVLLPVSVHGPWWERWGPGVGLCSATDLLDPVRAQEVCYRTFVSSV